MHLKNIWAYNINEVEKNVKNLKWVFTINWNKAKKAL